MIKLTIDYEPTPKGVPRTRYIPEQGRTITYYHWKTMEAIENIREMISLEQLQPFPNHTPVKLDVVFYRTKSKWLPKRETMPFRKPDLDNFLKLTLDTITETLVPDDAQITSINAKKRWSVNGHGYIELELMEDTDA